MEIRRSGAWEDVLPEDYLELSNGVVVKNLMELIEALIAIDKDSFALHVSSHYNDFAEWIMDTYGDELLAKKIMKAKTKIKIVKVLNDALKKSEMFNSGKIRAPKKKKDALKILGESFDEM